MACSDVIVNRWVLNEAVVVQCPGQGGASQPSHLILLPRLLVIGSASVFTRGGLVSGLCVCVCVMKGSHLGCN